MMRWLQQAWRSTVIGSACGDDDDDSAGDMSEYCEASLALETAPEPDIDFETATPEEITAATKSFATETFIPLAQRLRETAADEVMDDIDIGMAALDDLAETGDFEASLGTPEVDAALDRLHAHDLETCEWNTVDVTAADYAFQGVPTSSTAGVTSFEFTNGGTEVHEMVLFRRNDGVTETVDELLAMPEDEVETKTTMIAGTGARPERPEYAVADLTAGHVRDALLRPGGHDERGRIRHGQPHFMRGMVYEFTVA